MRYARSIVICLFVIGSVLQVPLTASANPELSVQSINGETVTADILASRLAGDGVSVVGPATYSPGAPNASGTFSGGEGIIGFGSGILLTSGNVNNVVGPNNFDNITADNGGDGDLDLTALSGFPTNDASVLEFNFTTDQPTVFFQYVFASDEYNEFSNSLYNDTFGFFVNNTNCATVAGLPITVNTINQTSHSDLYRNNDLNDGGGSINTEMDGLTTVLTCEATNLNVGPESTNHIKLAIADATDYAYDSAVFLEAGSFSTTPPDRTLSVTTTTTGGGSGNVTSDPAGIDCPGTEACSSQFEDTTNVTLTATPGEGSDFGEWAGCDSTDGNICNVTMDADKDVTASFVVHQNALTVTNPGSGTGTVTFGSGESPPTCTLGPSTSCSKTFYPGTIVTLFAAAASGSNFSGWSGEGCSGTGTCTVTMNAAKSVIASFNQNSTSNSTSGYVPPGGTIQTCQSTSSTDNTCSAITLPSGGPGATITITEQAGSTSTICNGPCSNQTTFYSITCTPATPCYTDTKKPVKVILRYKLQGTSTKADMYFQHASTTTSFKIPDCKKNGIANPNPCVSARKRLGIGNNDLQVQVLVTSDDPTIGKR